MDAVSIRPIPPDCLTDKMHHPRHSKQDAVPRRGQTPQFDSLGLPPRSLVLQFDLLRYMAFKRAHQSARSNRSIDSVLSGAESGDGEEGSVWSTRSRGRRSRRGSLTLSGKYVVLVVPPFKGSRSSTPAAAERKEEGGKDEMTLERELISTSGSDQHSWPDVPYHSPPAMSLIDSPLE